METPRTSLRRPSRAPWIAIGIAVLVGAGAAIWYSRSKPTAPPAAEQPTAQPTAIASETPSGPDLDAAAARALLDGVSQDELVRKGTSQEDVVRRWAIVTDNLAEGVSPRKQLQFLAPHGKFSVVDRGGKLVMSPESYARYDRFGDAVASIDVAAAVKAYRAMHGMVERAYRALGYPEGSLDRITARALRRIAAVPVLGGDVEVVAEGGGFYRFADPKLQALGDTEKHLLRMGPRNAGIVQAKARELLAALGFSDAPPGGASR
ncbi:MAG TPA: DUF3014 domain-containing protein [Anaeromyxobacteraceae bacterium]|nr:DUF3014 domain-containing protein [Anaeromyxobacteraceae bacterium]